MGKLNMNFIRAASLRVGDVIYTPNHIGQWSQSSIDTITKIDKGVMSGMLTLHLSSGYDFKVHPESQVPFVTIGNVPKNQEEKTPMDNLKAMQDALVAIYTLEELQLLREGLRKQLDDIMDGEKFRPSQTIEAMKEFNHKLNMWIKVNDPISAAIIYLKK
jgi:hypothetical protein